MAKDRVRVLPVTVTESTMLPYARARPPVFSVSEADHAVMGRGNRMRKTREAAVPILPRLMPLP
jgi:hypothetical protein